MIEVSLWVGILIELIVLSNLIMVYKDKKTRGGEND